MQLKTLKNLGGFTGGAGILAGVFPGGRKKLAGKDASAPSVRGIRFTDHARP